MAKKRRRRRRNSPRTKTVVRYRDRAVGAIRRRRSKNSDAAVMSGKAKGYIAAGAAVYGYGDEKGWGKETLEKVPVIGNRAISTGIALHLLNKHLVKSKYLDYVATGALSVGAYKFGVAQAQSKKPGLSGDDGYVGADEFDYSGYIDV